MPRRKPLLYCSFCRRDNEHVEKLIAGPGVHICDRCIDSCNRILANQPAPTFPGFESLADDALLTTLQPAAVAVDTLRDVLQEHVDLLRKRGVSWARIGDALGISRQAAWERFA